MAVTRWIKQRYGAGRDTSSVACTQPEAEDQMITVRVEFDREIRMATDDGSPVHDDVLDLDFTGLAVMVSTRRLFATTSLSVLPDGAEELAANIVASADPASGVKIHVDDPVLEAEGYDITGWLAYVVHDKEALVDYPTPITKDEFTGLLTRHQNCIVADTRLSSTGFGIRPQSHAALPLSERQCFFTTHIDHINGEEVIVAPLRSGNRLLTVRPDMGAEELAAAAPLVGADFIAWAPGHLSGTPTDKKGGAA